MRSFATFGLTLFDKIVALRNAIADWFLDRWFVLFKFAAILGVLGASVAFSLGAARYTRYAPLFLAVAVVPVLFLAIDFLLKRFELFPIIILLMAAFVPLSLPTGTGSRLVFSLVATMGFFAIWLLHMLLVEKRFHIEPTPLNAPILAFMVTTVVSLVWSNLFRDPQVMTWRSFPFVQAASALVMIMLPMALLIVVNFVKHERTLMVMVAVILLAGVLGIPRQFFGIRIPPVNTGGMFTMWVILYAGALGLFHAGLKKWQRALLLGQAGLWMFWGVGLHISWLAGWLPGLVGMGIIVWMRSKKLVFWLGLAAAFLLAINYNTVFGYVNEVLAAENSESGETRLAAWEVNWRVTREHWLFGTGPAGYAAYYMTYFPLEGTATHSNYIDIVAQTGMVGLGLILWVFFGLALIGFLLVLRLHGRGDFFEAAANAAFAGTIGCMLMMAFGDWLFPFAYTQSIAGFDYAVYNWLFMGTILVIERMTRSTPIPKSQAIAR
ncbi:MAG: O-antigen ligase family protein [Chloroflexota bacterium]